MEEPRSQKTERPTSRRLQKSREKGQVPRSQELPAALVLGGFLLYARVFGASFMDSAGALLTGSIASAAAPGEDPATLLPVLRAGLLGGFALGAPILGSVVIASAVGQFAQGGFVFSGESLAPNPARFNPVANLKAVFSSKRLVATLRTVVKLGLVAWVVYATLTPEMPAMLALAGSPPQATFSFAGALVGRVLFKFFLFAIGLALVDYLYQKFEHLRGLKMTKQEVRDERREIEGDPLVRSRQRAKQAALARRRMMAEIPRADVVVVNPTHCAVALRYDRSREGAPRVVAKGVDRIAQRIRAIAEEHGVPVWEDAPLAWAIHKAVEIGREIPADLYRAVAEVIAHVYRLKGRRRQRRPAAAGLPGPEAGPRAPSPPQPPGAAPEAGPRAPFPPQPPGAAPEAGE